MEARGVEILGRIEAMLEGDVEQNHGNLAVIDTARNEWLDHWHERFVEAFYDMWDAAGFGEHDTDCSCPSGMPWHASNAPNAYATVGDVAGRVAGDEARKHFLSCKDEIKDLIHLGGFFVSAVPPSHD